MTSRLPGFYRLPIAERRKRLAELASVGAGGGVTMFSFRAIDPGGLPLEAADGMIENVIGTYALPFAVAVNFVIDGVDALVPMAVEEPSIVAAASNAARMARAGGGFTSVISAPVMIGQIQVTQIADVDAAMTALAVAAPALLADARRLVPRLAERGGGPLALEPRLLARSGPDGGMIVAHLHVDCRDAMGANLVNTLCEALAEQVARIAHGRAGLRILTNLTDGRTVTIRVRIADAALAEDAETGAEVREAIAAASRFAELDPYRAATHNKGIMNGVDAVLVATGQDWRAVEAGAHAYAARSGAYRPLAIWRSEDDALVGNTALPSGSAASPTQGWLVGELMMPLAVGTVGGALHNHPAARLALELAGVEHADRLAALAGAAGLATNLAALRALATEGIQRGHMALHARGVARAAGATGELVEQVAAELAACGDIKPERAREVLARLQEPPRGPALSRKESP